MCRHTRRPCQRRAEFDALGDLELDDVMDASSAPGVPTTDPAAAKVPAGAVTVDEFGLPELPS